MSTLTPVETDRGIDTLDSLDFVITLPCEHSKHESAHISDQSAWGLCYVLTPCGDETRYLICKSGWNVLTGASKVHCPKNLGGCGEVHDREECDIRMLDVINDY